MKAVLALVFSVVLVAPVWAGGGFSGTAGSPFVPVRDGCGPGFHLNDYGHCRPNGWEREREERRERLVCPRGYHLGDGGRACWPNR